MSRIVDVEPLDCLAWKDGEHGTTFDDGVLWVLERIGELPAVQPERLTDDDFETIRIHLNAYKEKLCNQQRWKEAEEYQRIIDRFMAFASVQPQRKTDEWCPDCKEYDSEKHCCPRWNRVIRQTLSEQPERKKGEWWADPNDFDEWYCCSVCHKGLTMFDGTYDFCPNCGADMRGDSE